MIFKSIEDLGRLNQFCYRDANIGPQWKMALIECK